MYKAITEKRFSCSAIEKTPKDSNARFGENSRVIVFYQNTKSKTLVCNFQKKNLLSVPTCKLTNSKCTYF